MGRAPLLALLPLSGCLWISRDDHRVRTDLDGDGSPSGEDCDDDDPLVYPTNAEDSCDGRDNDCDPSTPDGPAAIGTSTYGAIQDALDAATAGDTIVLCPGVHTGAITLTHAVTLTGSISPNDTVVDATGSGLPALTVTGGGATIRKLTLTGGTGIANPRPDLVAATTIGGGLLAIDASGTVLLEDVVISGNTADAGGGVFGPVDAPLEILRTVIRENTASLGGGLCLPSGTTLNASSVSANTASVGGGGIAVLAGANVSGVAATTIQGNSAPTGGGLWLSGNWSGGTIEENAATAQGGGVWLDAGTLVGALVARNTAAEGGGVAGSGIVEDGTVDGNTAASGGGILVNGDLDLRGELTVSGNLAEGGSGGGVLVASGTLSSDSAGIEISGNHADDGGGGGVAVVGGSLDLLFGLVLGNFAARGAGIAIEAGGTCVGCTFDLTSVDLQANTATGAGGGLWLDAGVRISDCDTDGNVAGTSGGGIYIAAGGTADIAGGTLGANTAGQFGGGLAVYGTAVPTTVNLLTLQGNGAEDGAAIRVGPGATVDVTSSEIKNNQTTTGAAVSLEAGVGGTTRFTSVGSVVYLDNAAEDVNAGSYTYDATAAVPNFVCLWPDGAPQGSCAPF